jgi:hypothetical protein
VVFFDTLRAKIRDEGLVKNKAVYVALGAQYGRREGHAGSLDRGEIEEDVPWILSHADREQPPACERG